MTKKPPPPEEDEEQSARFLETAKELEAAGDLNPTEGDKVLSKLVSAQARGRPRDSG